MLLLPPFDIRSDDVVTYFTNFVVHTSTWHFVVMVFDNNIVHIIWISL